MPFIGDRRNQQANQQSNQQSNQAAQNTQPSAQTSQSSYQINTFPSAQQQQTNLTQRNILGRIFEIGQTNVAGAAQLYQQYQYFRNDPSSPIYNIYSKPTNNAISHLQQLGFDTNQLTDDWFKGEGGQFIQQNLIYNGTSNTPTNPTNSRKYSQNQKIAYWLYQYDKSEGQTKEAESEYQKAMNEAYYWAQRTDRNYSDEEIIGKVRENFASKYPTLAKMEANGTMAPLEMNRAIDFSDDALYGAIYMGRNPDFNGSMEQAMAFNALGRGNKWELNQEISDKLDPNSATFDGGYSLGCTNLDDAALYFGMRSFPKEWVVQNQQMAFSSDETERQMYMKVRAGYENQVKAEEELKALYDYINRKIQYLSDPKEIMKKIDNEWKKYPTLAKMDASIGQHGNIMTGDMVALTEGVNYRYDNLKEQVVALCTKKAAAGDCNDYITYITSAASIAEGEPSIVTEDIDGKGSKWHPTYKPTEEQIQVAKANDKEIAESAELTETASTPAEKAVSEKQLSSMYETTKDYLVQMKEGGEQVVKNLAPTAVKGSIYGYSKSVLSGFDTISDYEQRSKAIETLETRKAELSDKLGDLIYAGKNYGENEVVPVTINGKTYDLTLSWNPNYAQGEYDEETGERERIGSYQAVNVSEAGSKGEAPVAEWDEDAVKEAIDRANSGKSSSDKMHNAAITEEQQAEIAEYWKIDSNLESSRIRQQELQADYDKAKKAIDDAKTVQNMTISLMKEAGLDTKQMEDAAVVTDFFLNFTKYDPTEWPSYNLYHSLSSELISGNTNTEEMFKTAETGDKEILQAIDVAKTMLEYADENGIQLPDNVRENVQRYIDSLEAQHQDFEYMSLIRNEDFKSESEEGRKLWSEMNQFDDKAFAETGTLESQPSWNLLTEEQRQHLTYLMEQANSFENPMGIDIGTVIEEYNGYLDGLNIENRLFGGIPATTTLGEIMTDYELDTFYYLLQKGGLEQANAYADHLTEGNGVLNSRLRERTEENAKALADKGLFGRGAANVLSMLLSPIQAAQSLTYTLGYGVRKSRGERVEWNPNSADLSANIYKKSAREEIQNEIARTYENPVLRKVMSVLQEIISNRGDSIVNGFVFGNFFNGISNQYLQEFLSAVPMAVSAATDAVSEAKEKGASDTQLLGIYATTLLLEAGTEAVSLDNIRKSLNLGKDLTVDGLKDWAKNWLTKSGISEMIGETITEAVEQAADTYFLGENSDYAKAVKKYQEEEGMSEEEAKRQASLDQVINLLHTALISYLSPGMDVGSYALGRYSGYRSEARYLQEHGENVSVLDVYRDYKQNRENTEKQSKIQKEIEEIERNNTNPNMEEASEQEAGVAVPEAEQETITPEQKAAQDLTIDYEILETAIGKDPSSQTASVASVLDTQRTDESSDMANAAAANISNLFGDTTPAEGMQTLIIGAHAAGVDASVVKQAIQTAALSENSAAYNMIQSEEFRNADPGKKAQLLASTVEADANNANVQGQVTKSIYENRVARAEKTVINLPEVKKKNTAVYEAQGFLLKAQETTQMAQKNLESVQMEQEAMVGDVMTAGEQHFQDPLDHAKADMFDSKMRELDRHDKVVQEYRQSLEKAQNDEKSAQSKVDRAVEDYANEKRKAAQQIVNEQDQQRAGAKVQAQAEAVVQAEQQAQQALAQEEENNAAIADREAFVEKYAEEHPGTTEEDKQKLREMFDKNVHEMNKQRVPNPARDQEGRLTEEAKANRDKFVRQVSKKFGIKIDIMDTSEGGKKIKANGYYDQANNRIVLDSNATMSDAMYIVLGHELTHIAEQSKTYNALANSILRIAYGDNADYETAIKNLKKNKGIPRNRLEADIAHLKLDVYDKQLRRNHSYEYIAQELVADKMGALFNPQSEEQRQDLINRLVGDDPSVARRILDSIKSFLKKAVGMKGAWLTNTQKTVEMLESALKEAQDNSSTEGERQNRYSLPDSFSADQIIQKQNEQKDEVDSLLSVWNDGNAKPVGEVYKILNESSYPALYQWMHNQYEKRNQPIKKSDIVRFMEADKDLVSQNAQSIYEGWNKISDDYPNGINAVPISDTATTNAGIKKRSESVASDLFDNRKYIDVTNKDTNSTLRIDEKTIEESFQHNKLAGKNGVPNSVVEQVLKNSKRLLEKGIYIGSHTNYADERGNIHYIVEPVSSNDYVDAVVFAIHDKAQGADVDYAGRAYVTEISIIQKQDASGSLGRWSSNPTVPQELHQMASAISIEDILNSVNTDRIRFFDKNAIGNTTKSIAQDENGNSLAEELPGGTVVLDTGERYSLSSFTPEEQNKVRDALIDSGRFSVEEIDKYLGDALSIASIVAADRDRLDFTADPEKTMLKPNAEYVKTLDASTLCAKRLLYQGTFNEIQHALPNTPLMPEDLIDLSNMMRDMGYETPCGICYVESRRRQLGKFTEQWLESYDGEYKPTIDEVTTSDGLEKLRKEHPQAYQDFINAMNKKGTMNPKVVQLRTDYKGEIRSMTPAQIQKVKDIGGLRVQSFSDFETPHLLDMAQAVMDMSAKGLTAQAYTKVPNFPWAFGDTGIKINLSLIGKGTGVDSQGNLIFDDVEGMPFDEAMKLRDRYSKNVGTILVGINDEHIKAAMADPRIDFIIPFHKSGWSKEELNKMPVLNGYSDYTDSQNEKAIVGKSKNGTYKTESLEKTKRVNFQPVGENGYWDFTKTGKENAENYLKMCAKDKRLPKFSQFLVDNGDGSFSLQPDGSTDGYWKTLIDFKMYDNDGVGSPQQEVTPNINMPEATRILNEYSLERNGISRESNNDLPVAQPVVDRFVEEYKTSHPLDENRVRYSLPSDAPYLSAVDHGDMETAQRMVDEKAKENGYIKAGYHGTLNGGFTVFDKRKAHVTGNSGAGFYFSSSSTDSESNYSDTEGADNWFKAKDLANKIIKDFRKSGEDRTEYEGYEITWDMPFDEVVEIAKKILTKNSQTYHVYLDPGRAYVRDGNNSTNLIEDIINNTNSEERSDAIYQAISNAVYSGIADVDKNFKIVSNLNYEKIIDNLFNVAITNNKLTMEDIIDKFSELDFEKMMNDIANAIDLGYTAFDDISNTIDQQAVEVAVNDDETEKAEATREVARAIVEAFGFDSIEDREVGLKFNQLKNLMRYKGIPTDTVHYIMFHPEQIKLADPVVYDDNGNVIPLSERFNDQEEDIRYSLPSDDVLNQQINDYIANGGSLARTQSAPTGYRQWGNEGAQQSDELVEEAKQRVLNSEYTKDTNAEELDRAIDWIRSNKRYADDDGFQESLRKVMSKRFNYQSKDGQARMVAVMALAVARKDTYAQVQLAEAYNEQGTALGQALQARKLFRLMTPAGRVATLQRMLSRVQDQLDAKNIQKTITLSDWIIQAASEATDERQFARIQKAAAAELAEQIPANWKDKLRGLRMLSMLGNPRTHVRNFIGNMLFVPAVGLKNKMGALIELGQEQGKRTKTINPFLSKKVRDFARQDAEFMKDDLTGESKYNEGNMVQREQKPFKGFVQKLMDSNSNWLEKEDWFFLKGHYRRALGGWIEANGYTIDQLKSNPALLDQGRAYAINEAQKATYRDFNGLADRLNKLSRNPETTGQKVLGFAVDAVLPFKKTPANILKRGLEYSPVGLVRGLKNLAFDMKSGKITPTQVIDRICSGLAGSAILAMGAFLSAAGVVTCDLGDDKDKNEKEQGNQKYSIKLHLFGEDVTYTMDWAAPMSMPFFVGAAIQQQLAKKGDFDINAVMDSLGNIAEPVLNLSMLDGVNTLFKTSQYDDTDTITQIGAKVASNYITSYVPSVLGAITRSFADDRRRATFVKSGEGKGITGTFRYAWEQVENKVPGLSRTNIPVRDVFGNEETDSLAERLIENFISPGYISHYKNNPILKEMDRLYNANVTDSEDMVPKDPPKSFTYGDNKYVLSAEQWDQYKAVRGRTAYELLTDLINSDGYKSADNEAQIQMIKQCWEYAGKVGKASIIPEYRIDEASENPVEDVITEGKVTSYNTKMLDALAAGDYEGYETMVEALREAGVEDSKIKEKIRNRYIKKYKEAYIAEDYPKMDEIEEILTYSGFDFDLDEWESQVDKKRNQ